MRKRARVVRLSLVLLFVVTQLLFAPPAHAVACPAGKHIFIRQGSTSLRWGVRGKLSVPNNNLDACSTAATFTTVHFNNCASKCATQVEIGIRDTSSGPKIFTEKEVNGQVTRFDLITTAPHDNFVSFRLRVAQNGDVIFQYNFGSGWETTWSSPYSIGWGSGYPMGESEKIGDDTQMKSHHRDMMYITQSWAETAWGGMTCVQDEAPGWSWKPFGGSTNEWDVVGVGGPTCAAA